MEEALPAMQTRASSAADGLRLRSQLSAEPDALNLVSRTGSISLLNTRI
jgi:hypothetical protein